ncbi:MAG: D-alanyl-D-alanine carboxypeptidase family protein [Kiloniellales bacterium]
MVLFRDRRRRRLGVSMVLATGLWTAAAQALETSAKQAYLLDFDTGVVLFEKNADVAIAPASMTKIMTLHLLFQRLRDGGLSLDDTMLVTDRAWKRGGSRMFVELDARVRVEDLIRGIAVQSGNDASIVVAEGIAGSENHFAQEMTASAHDMGMTDTNFTNSTGWPDAEHVSTARDLAILTIRTIQDFPEFYHYYKETSFTYNGIRQGNRNPLLYKEMGADGLKTGYTEESGYGLAVSAVQDGRRLVLVAHGMESVRERSREAQRLLDWGFREFNNYALFAAGEIVAHASVWLGDALTVPMVIQRELTVTLPRKARRGMRVATVYQEPIPAPIEKGAVVARLVVTAPGVETIGIPLVAGKAVKRLPLVPRLTAALGYLLWGSAAR